MDKLRADLVALNNKLYADTIVSDNKFDNSTNKIVNDFINDKNRLMFSTKNRFAQHFQYMKYNFLISPKSKLICTCFRVTRIDDIGNNDNSDGVTNIDTDSTTSVYGYLYSEYKPNQCTNKSPDELDYNDLDPDYEKPTECTFEHKYMCFGGTYISQDGEYRRRFVLYDRIKLMLEKFTKQCAMIENAIIEKMNKQRLIFHVETFYPDGDHAYSQQFDEDLNASRITIYLYMLCVLNDYYLIENMIVENHINAAYLYIVHDPEYKPTFNEILSEMSDIQYQYMSQYSESYSYKVQQKMEPDGLTKFRMGQKVFPMTNQEEKEKFNIDFSVWREHYVGNMCNDLVVNGVSPNFSVSHVAFLIQNTNANMFDNPSAEVKYEHGDVSSEISHDLHAVDSKTYERSLLSDPKHLSQKFAHLSTLINQSIDYADYNISMSDKTLCVISEYVGRTIRDMPSFIISKNTDINQWKTFATNTNAYLGYMFEYAYGLYCMNSLLGCMQGDLHVNNATLHRLYNYDIVNNTRYKMYVLGDGLSYVFEHVGIFGCIIDYSRSIIGNYQRVSNDFGEPFANTFFSKQASRIHALIKGTFPQLYTQYQKQLDDAIENNLESLFKVISIIDLYMLTRGMSIMYKQETGVKFNPEILAITDSMYEYTRKLFIDTFTELMTNKSMKVQYLTLTFIKHNFQSNLLSAMPTAITDKIVDVFVYKPTNMFKYSMSNYEHFHPLLKVEPILEAYAKYNLVDPGYQTYLDFAMGEQAAEDSIGILPKKSNSWMWQ